MLQNSIKVLQGNVKKGKRISQVKSFLMRMRSIFYQKKNPHLYLKQDEGFSDGRRAVLHIEFWLITMKNRPIFGGMGHIPILIYNILSNFVKKKMLQCGIFIKIQRSNL